MIVLSLFDGLSCGRVALERAGIPITKYYASEIDKHAEAISKFHYPDIFRLGDVTKWQEWDIEKPDIILAGFPCQSFSLAGKRLNFDDDRGKLFFTLCDILEYYNPKYFLLENVQMKSSIERAINLRLGEIFPQYAQPELLSSGEIKPYFLNSALVSAQSRKRNYWCNWRVDKPQDKQIFLKDILESDLSYHKKSYCITATYSNTEFSDSLKKNQRSMVAIPKPVQIGHIGSNSQGNRIYSVLNKSVTLQTNSGGIGSNTGLYKIDLPYGDYAIRKLTPVECERLQNLTDNFTEKGIYEGEIKEVANTNRYKAIGNGWTVDMIVHILKNNKNLGG